MSTQSRSNWSEQLRGKTSPEAWYLIYDLTRPLTRDERERLWTYYKKIHGEEVLKEVGERVKQLDKLF